MADIRMCDGVGCPRANDCYRHTAPKSTHWQSYFINTPINDDKTCDHFWDKTK